jgi:transcriptional regulator with XRE-family HTH domain
MQITTTGNLVASEVRAELGRQRISGSALAKSLGMSQAGISRRLRGEVPFDVDELSAIAALLNVPLSALLTGSTSAA